MNSSLIERFNLNFVMNWILTLNVCILSAASSSAISIQSYENVSSLVINLLDGYDRRQRPVLNQSFPVYVKVSFQILALVVSHNML